MHQNFYPQNFQEQQRLQSYQNGRRNNQPLNDGFGITDSSSGTVVAVDGQSRADYDQMVKSNFKYTQDNYQEAYKEAARTGKPIVAIFGGFENNNSRQLIDNSLPEAKSGAAKDAVYIYVDRAKTKDPELAKFADGQLAGGHNAAVSIVFNVRPGEDGSIRPEAPNFRWQGADRSMISSFNQAIGASKEKQELYTGKFSEAALAEKPNQNEKAEETEKSEKSERSAKPDGGGDKFSEARQLITKEITAASEAKDWQDAERHYHEAIQSADKITPEEIRAEQHRIARTIATTPQDSPAFQQLVKDSANLTFVKNAKATTRADLGIACMEWSEEQNSAERKQKFREIGSHWIESAALRNPLLHQNPEFLKRLDATNIPAAELLRLLPKLGTSPPQRDLFQFGGDGQRSSITPPDTKPPETQPSDTRPPDTKPSDIRPSKVREDAEKQARRLKAIKEDGEKAVKTSEEYYAALQDAADKGLPVLVKVGAEWCTPCKEMAPALKEAEEALKGKAVVIRVRHDIAATEELANSLGADKGIPITKFARPVPRDKAHLGLNEVIPERHKGFTDREKKDDFKQEDEKDTLDYFVANGLAAWKRRQAAKR